MSEIDISVTRHGSGWLLETEQVFPRPPEAIFPFFADAYNLEKITPSFLTFNVVTPRPIEMRSGAIIDYRLRVRGVPIRWRTEILDFDPPRSFVDNQVRGPYARWHHTHTFEPTADGRGTVARDRVEYEPPGWVLKGLVHALFVKRDVVGIFEYRGRVLGAMFGGASGTSHQASGEERRFAAG